MDLSWNNWRSSSGNRRDHSMAYVLICSSLEPVLIPYLAIRPAETINDFMVVRKIRNSCRQFMTTDWQYISLPSQVMVYLKYHSSDKMKIIYIGCEKKGHAIAYGLITYDRNFYPWITGGVLPAFRGKGYGTELFRFLSTEWHIPLYLEVMQDNSSAYNLYARLGFQEIRREDTNRGIIVTMKKEA